MLEGGTMALLSLEAFYFRNPTDLGALDNFFRIGVGQGCSFVINDKGRKYF